MPPLHELSLHNLAAAIAVRFGAGRVMQGDVVDGDDARSERRVTWRRAHPEVQE